MRISISINGVLRDVLKKMSDVYEKYTQKECKADINLTENLLEVFDFDTEEELFEFIYVECPMEIFGHGTEAENNVFNSLNEFYKDKREDYDIYLVSDEIEKSKPATLFFLSKYGTLVERIEFYTIQTIDNLWERTDIFITDNKLILNRKPEGKLSIKIDKPHNKDIESDITLDSFKDVLKLDDDRFKQI
tara:strand:+ start:717 stop:1286 length:570 start_codon:yes stop_codon:yes gene_type:complete